MYRLSARRLQELRRVRGLMVLWDLHLRQVWVATHPTTWNWLRDVLLWWLSEVALRWAVLLLLLKEEVLLVEETWWRDPL